MTDLSSWLDELGLSKYANVFVEQEIDFSVLTELAEKDLKDLGIPLGPRKKLLRAIALLSTRAEEDITACSAPASTEAERRQLSILFCDLVGSTELSQRLEPEDLREVISAYQDACKTNIEHYGGFVARYMGDGVLAYFGYPQAHEDDVERAVRGGIGVVEAVEGLNPTIGKQHGAEFAVRVGIATGPVVVGDLIGDGASQESAVLGQTPNLAARLQALAEPGSVLLADQARSLLGARFDCEDLGERKLKGFYEPVRVWRVTKEQFFTSRFEGMRGDHLTPFVGREQELALLLNCWHQAGNGEGQVVLLSGESGVGKSRIVETLSDHLSQEKLQKIIYQCSPYHLNSALFPVARQLELAAGLSFEDSPDKKLEKLRSLLQESVSETPDWEALVASLLSIGPGDRDTIQEMTPQEQKQKTFSLLADYVSGLAGRRPILLVLEDAHWIDPTTQEFIAVLIARAQALKILMIITFRPEFEPPWASRCYSTTLTLNRLSSAQSETIIARVTGGRVLPAEVVETIKKRTDGIPLFVEELTKAVLDSGLLVQHKDRYALESPLPALAIPTTLQDSLVARLDRLGRAKEVAQIGATIGREFPQTLLAAVSPLGEDALERSLEHLVASEIVFPRTSAFETTYVFKHALIRDAAYETLLLSRRKQIHASIARALETHFPEQALTQPEVLAHHYTCGALPQEAVSNWIRAGQLAITRSSNAEAIAHLNKGMSMLGDLASDLDRDRLELELQVALGLASMAKHGYGAKETERAYRRAFALIGDATDDPRVISILHGLCAVTGSQAKFGEVLELAHEQLDRATRLGDAELLCVGHRTLSYAYNAVGEFLLAFDHACRAVTLYDRNKHYDSARRFGHDAGVAALMHLMISSWYVGDLGRSAKAAEQGLDLARALRHANTLGYALFWIGFIGLTARDAIGVYKIAEEQCRLGVERHLPLWESQGRGMLAAAMIQKGEVEAGLDHLHSSMACMDQNQFAGLRPTYWCCQAGGLTRLGRYDEARRVIENALQVVEETRERWWEAELHRLMGQTEQMAGAPGKNVEFWLKSAMKIARAQSARMLELRAATNLAECWCAEGKRIQARDLIKPLVDSFSDEFEIPDLKDARVLMNELS